MRAKGTCPQRWPGCSAFTLVELLVVIGILATLIALLLPSLSKARQTAQTLACLSQLRQFGQSVLIYVNDYHAYPHADEPYTIDPADPLFADRDSNEWVRILPRFWRKGWKEGDRFTEPMFRCPIMDQLGLTGNNRLHYGMSHFFDPTATGMPSSDCVKPSKIHRTSEIVAFADKNGPGFVDALGRTGPDGPFVRNRATLTTSEWPAIRHNKNKVTCIVFADGHGEPLVFSAYASARSWDWRLR